MCNGIARNFEYLNRNRLFNTDLARAKFIEDLV